jgi:hypothetical protein
MDSGFLKSGKEEIFFPVLPFLNNKSFSAKVFNIQVSERGNDKFGLRDKAPAAHSLRADLFWNFSLMNS